MKKRKKYRTPKRFLYTITFISTFGGLLFGYDTGVINGALPYMSRADQLDLTPLTEGLVTSSLLLGAALGALLCGRLSDHYGRRKTILNLALLFFITTLGCTFAPNVVTMVTSRFLLGLAVGGASVTVPAYLSEISPMESRGRLVTQNELMIVTGQLLAFIINAILGNAAGDHEYVWRFMLVVATIPAIVLFIGMLMMPESPRWLISKRKVKDGLTVLRKVREKNRARAELNDIKKMVHTESQIKKVSYKDLNVPWIRRIVLLGIGIGIVQQITGVNTIMYYGTEILRTSGFSTGAALIGNIANGVISVSITFVAIWLLGRVGRRPMLLTGLMGTTTSLLLIGIFSIILHGSPALRFVVLTLTVTFLAFQQGAVSPVTWLMLSEIFPLRLRGFGMGVSVFCSWTTNFSVGLTFPLLVSFLGLSTTFFIFVVFGIGAITFVKKFLPETKDCSLEELEQRFRTDGTHAQHKIGTGIGK
ncbi:sugar porter family MFS transporter [Sporolactobacillus sp. THM7-7]|nr:sugar porter family MFS transporter [Sporolactobacillus sp. THM7-7]